MQLKATKKKQYNDYTLRFETYSVFLVHLKENAAF